MSALALYSCSTYDETLLDGSAAAGAGAGANNTSGSAGVLTSGGAPAGAGSVGMAGGDASAGQAGANAGNAGLGGSSGGESGSGGMTVVTDGGGGAAAGAGSGGSSGSTGSAELIDDFEDRDALILSSHGRNGRWYVFNDGTVKGMESPFSVSLLTGANVRAGSTSTAALHVTATGFADWGAGVGADFVNVAAAKVAYDVSAYSGIQFYAKVAAGSPTTLKLLLPTIYSDPDGGICSNSVAGKHCDDHLYSAVNGLKTTWDVYLVSFAALMQAGFGLPQATFDPTSTYGVQFTQPNKTAIDLWIDDLSFIKK